jgi:hypothetical protein
MRQRSRTLATQLGVNTCDAPSVSLIDLDDYNDFENEQRVCLARADRKLHRLSALTRAIRRPTTPKRNHAETRTFTSERQNIPRRATVRCRPHGRPDCFFMRGGREEVKRRGFTTEPQRARREEGGGESETRNDDSWVALQRNNSRDLLDLVDRELPAESSRTFVVSVTWNRQLTWRSRCSAVRGSCFRGRGGAA